MSNIQDCLSGIMANENAIPVGVDSFVEAAAYAAQEIDYEFDNLMESVCVVNESGEQVIQEAGFFDSAKAFFEKAWAAIKKFFEDVANWFKDKIAKAKESMQKAFYKGAAKLSNSKKIDAEMVKKAVANAEGKEFKAKYFHLEYGALSSDLKSSLSEADKDIDVIKKIMDFRDAAKSGTEVDESEFESIPGKLIGTNDKITVSEMKQKFKEMLVIKEEKKVNMETYSKDWAEAKKNIEGGGDLKMVKDAYNKVRDQVKKIIQNLEKMKKEKDMKDNKGAVVSAIKYAKLVLQCVKVLCAVECDTRKERFVYDFNVLRTIYKYGRKKEKESASDATLESVFAW